MNKKILLNVFLLVLLVILAIIITNSDEPDTELKPLTALDSSQISSITISHNSQKTLLVKQATGHWQITRPVSIDANDFRVNTLLKLLSAPVHADYRLDEIDVKAIGLDTPEASISFNDHKISFGIVNPATELRYLLYNQHIYTIQDVYFPLINSQFSTLVSPGLLPRDAKIEKLILLNQTISQDMSGRWQSNKHLDPDKVATVLDNWKTSQAFGIHEYLERENHGDVYIKLINGNTIHYRVTDIDPWVILARPELGLEYHLEKDSYDKLLAP